MSSRPGGSRAGGITLLPPSKSLDGLLSGFGGRCSGRSLPVTADSRRPFQRQLRGTTCDGRKKAPRGPRGGKVSAQRSLRTKQEACQAWGSGFPILFRARPTAFSTLKQEREIGLHCCGSARRGETVVDTIGIPRDRGVRDRVLSVPGSRPVARGPRPHRWRTEMEGHRDRVLSVPDRDRGVQDRVFSRPGGLKRVGSVTKHRPGACAGVLPCRRRKARWQRLPDLANVASAGNICQVGQGSPRALLLDDSWGKGSIPRRSPCGIRAARGRWWVAQAMQ